MDFRRFTDAEIALDPAKAHIMDYNKFLRLFGDGDTGKLLHEARENGVRKTIKHFRDHSDFSNHRINDI